MGNSLKENRTILFSIAENKQKFSDYDEKIIVDAISAVMVKPSQKDPDHKKVTDLFQTFKVGEENGLIWFLQNSPNDEELIKRTSKIIKSVYIVAKLKKELLFFVFKKSDAVFKAIETDMLNGKIGSRGEKLVEKVIKDIRMKDPKSEINKAEDIAGNFDDDILLLPENIKLFDNFLTLIDKIDTERASTHIEALNFFKNFSFIIKSYWFSKNVIVEKGLTPERRNKFFDKMARQRNTKSFESWEFVAELFIPEFYFHGKGESAIVQRIETLFLSNFYTKSMETKLQKYTINNRPFLEWYFWVQTKEIENKEEALWEAIDKALKKSAGVVHSLLATCEFEGKKMIMHYLTFPFSNISDLTGRVKKLFNSFVKDELRVEYIVNALSLLVSSDRLSPDELVSILNSIKPRKNRKLKIYDEIYTKLTPCLISKPNANSNKRSSANDLQNIKSKKCKSEDTGPSAILKTIKMAIAKKTENELDAYCKQAISGENPLQYFFSNAPAHEHIRLMRVIFMRGSKACFETLEQCNIGSLSALDAYFTAADIHNSPEDQIKTRLLFLFKTDILFHIELAKMKSYIDRISKLPQVNFDQTYINSLTFLLLKRPHKLKYENETGLIDFLNSLARNFQEQPKNFSTSPCFWQPWNPLQIPDETNSILDAEVITYNTQKEQDATLQKIQDEIENFINNPLTYI